MPHLISARSTFMVPVQWDDGHGHNVADRVFHLRHRVWEPRHAPTEVKPLWALQTGSLPSGTEELSPAFQAILSGQATDSPWAVTRLVLSRSIVDGLLCHGRLVDPTGREPFPSPRIQRVELLLLPLDVGVLSIDVDWLATEQGAVAPGELAHRLAQVRAGRDEGHSKDLAWRFAVEPSPSQAQVLGPRILAACQGQGQGRIGMANLVDWLVLLPDDDPAAPPRRTGSSGRVAHHTHVVLSDRLEATARADLLFRLRRGLRKSQLPPADVGPDLVLELRANRVLGVSRKGTVSLSELTGDSGDQYERDTWPTRWHGSYALLAAVLRAQHLALAERAVEVTHGQLDLSSSARNPAERRDQMRALAERISHQVLTMPGAEPGGLTDHAWFYRSLRDTLGLPVLVAEVRDQAHVLLERAERAYLEERRAREEQEHKAQAQREQEEARRDRRLHQVVATVGAVVLPATVISGLLGMNLPPTTANDAPTYIAWLVAVAAFCGLAAVLVGLALRKTLPEAGPATRQPGDQASSPSAPQAAQLWEADRLALPGTLQHDDHPTEPARPGSSARPGDRPGRDPLADAAADDGAGGDHRA